MSPNIIVCVICLKPFNTNSLQQDSSPVGDEEILASFKCLNTGVSMVTELCSSLRSAARSFSGDAVQLYCEECANRNKLIWTTLSTIRELEFRLSEFRLELEQDFRQSFTKDVEQFFVPYNIMPEVQRSFVATRHEVAKDLKILAVDEGRDIDWSPCVDVVGDFQFDEEQSNTPEPSIPFEEKPAKPVDVAEEVGRPSKNLSPRKCSEDEKLRRLFNVSNPQVRVRLLPNKLLSALGFIPKIGKKTSRKLIETRATSYRCYFEDCLVKGAYTCSTLRNEHMKAVHGLSDSTIIDLATQNTKRDSDVVHEDLLIFEDVHDSTKGGYCCTFPGCQFYESYSTSAELRQHLRDYHCINPSDSEDEPNNNSVFDKSEEQNVEQEESDSSNRFKCPYEGCESELNFSCKRDLSAHAMEAHGLKLPIRGRRRKIGASKAKVRQQIFYCRYEDCPIKRKFSTPDKRNEHVLKYHTTRMPKHWRKSKCKFQCDVLDCTIRRFFRTQEAKDSHMRWVHGDDPHIFGCAQCGKYFKEAKERNDHISKEHFGCYSQVCHLCGKGFRNASELKRHSTTHTNERVWKCKECPADFQSRGGLTLHTRREHKKEYFRSCEKCGKGFYSSTGFRNHVQSVHSDGARPIECEICGKRFAVRNYLYGHMAVHKREQGIPVPKRKRYQKKITENAS